MGEHKSYLDHCHHFLAYHVFATSSETERNNEKDSMEQNFPLYATG